MFYSKVAHEQVYTSDEETSKNCITSGLVWRAKKSTRIWEDLIQIFSFVFRND